jgi:hypothetical protein
MTINLKKDPLPPPMPKPPEVQISEEEYFPAWMPEWVQALIVTSIAWIPLVMGVVALLCHIFHMPVRTIFDQGPSP